MSLWRAYQPSEKLPWNFQRVWTLHRRTGFAATWDELQRDLADGPEKSIERILAGQSRSQGIPENFVEMRKIIGDAAVSSNRSERLIAWWLYQMCFSPDPLRERLAIMWHNHFATSNQKVNSLALMHQQNEVFRTGGLGNFKTLLAESLKQPAMIKWLDGDENRAGQANENLGRETLELFTLGVGNYTEVDVKNASRALTGWSVFNDEFRHRDDWHDQDEKLLLGTSGKFTGDDVVEITAGHPATAGRIAWRLCDEFLSKTAYDSQSQKELASTLSENELNIHHAMKTILGSQLFFSSENLKTRIIDPESFVIGSVRALEMFQPPASTMVLADWVQQMGRKLFYPPNVGGWPGGRAWLNSRTVIARANFGTALVNGKLNRSVSSVDFVGLAQRHGTKSNLDSLTDFYSLLLTGQKKTEYTKELVSQATRLASDKNEQVKHAIAQIIASPQAQLC